MRIPYTNSYISTLQGDMKPGRPAALEGAGAVALACLEDQVAYPKVPKQRYTRHVPFLCWACRNLMSKLPQICRLCRVSV